MHIKNISKTDARLRRHTRIRAKICGTPQCPRLCVFRSHTSTYAQLIDDTCGKTILVARDSSLEGADSKKGKVARAVLVGEHIAKQALKYGIHTVVFDRGGYKYHGRVKALAEGARKGGLKF